MCAPMPDLMAMHPGYRRVERNAIRHRRIHTFAANRFADAKTAAATKFWYNVMVACVKRTVQYEPIPEFWNMFR